MRFTGYEIIDLQQESQAPNQFSELILNYTAKQIKTSTKSFKKLFVSIKRTHMNINPLVTLTHLNEIKLMNELESRTLIPSNWFLTFIVWWKSFSSGKYTRGKTQFTKLNQKLFFAPVLLCKARFCGFSSLFLPSTQAKSPLTQVTMMKSHRKSATIFHSFLPNAELLLPQNKSRVEKNIKIDFDFRISDIQSLKTKIELFSFPPLTNASLDTVKAVEK